MPIAEITLYNPVSKAIAFNVGDLINAGVYFKNITGASIVRQWYKNGSLFTPASPWQEITMTGGVPGPNGAKILQCTNATSECVGSYVIRLFNSAPDTGYIDSDPIVVTALQSRLTQIAAEIKIMIESMTIIGGYKNNWGACNILDAAHRRNWPHALITYQLQQPGTDLSHYYGMLNAEFTITIEPKIIPSGTVNSVLDSDAYMDTALADLIRLFLTNTNYSYLPLSGEAVMSFKEATRENLKNGDVFRPGKLITKWNVHYHNS